MSAKLVTIAKNVTTAGTPVQLITTDLFVRELIIQGSYTNTSRIYVGGVTVTSTNAIVLGPMKSISMSDFLVGAGQEDYLNLKDIYIDSAVNGEGVRYMYIVR